MPTKAELEAELQEVKDNFENFKERVRNVAEEAKQEESWCDSGFNRAMRELGLRDDVEVEATVMVEFSIVGTMRKESGEVTKEDVQMAMHNLSQVTLSDDMWSDVDVSPTTVRCTYVDPI